MTTQFTTKRASQILFIVLTSCLLRSGSSAGACTETSAQQRHNRNTGCRTSLSSAERVAAETASMTRAGWQAIPDCRRGTRHAALWRNSLAARPRHTRRTKQQCHMEREKYRRESSWVFPKLPTRSRSARAGVARLSTVRLTTSAISISGSFGNRQGQMRGLPNFPGGTNGFATGANNLRQVVGWAENGVHDTDCASRTQVLQFRPAMWTLGPPDDQIHDLPLIPGDTSGAATAINDNGQIVGISGICDQAVGRHTAKHAVLWENGAVTDIWPNVASPVVEYADGNQSTTAMSSGLPATPPLLKATSTRFHVDQGRRHPTAQTVAATRTPQHVDSEAYGINEASPGSRCLMRRETWLIVVQLFGITAAYPQTSTISKAAILPISKAPKT